MGPYKASCVITGPYGFLYFLLRNGSVWVLIGPYLSLWILMGPYKSLRILMDSIRTLWVTIGPYGSL